MRVPTDTANITRASSQNQRKIFTKSRCTGTRERKRTTLDLSFNGANASSAGQPSLSVRQPAFRCRAGGSVVIGTATLHLRVFHWLPYVEADINDGVF